MALRSLLLPAVALIAAACGNPASGPVTQDKLDPLVRDKALPLEQQIAKIEADKNIPDPEKQRSLQVLRAKLAAGQR